MSNTEINNICGPTPDNYIPPDVTSGNYIFKVDPNFTPINLFDFWGNGATVTSFVECAHYVNGGWEPFKTTIFDIGRTALTLVIGIFLIYKFFNLKLYRYLSPKYIFSLIKKLFFLIKISKPVQMYLSYFFLIIQNYLLFDYVRTKASRIPRFIDEYIALASNINFFKSLDFNAGEIIGGNYSELLTSGPISAIGGVIGWNLTSKLVIARIGNFYWLFIVQLIFSIIIYKLSEKKEIRFLLFMNSLILILVPWWQGALYMIGEFASVIFFTNSIFLFNKYRSASMILFSLSIFFGKLLTIIPFSAFYFTWIIVNKEFKKIIKDISIFFIPMILWLTLVNFKYADGNFINYLNNLYNLVVGHQSSGINNFGINILNSPEVQSWNNFDLFRLLFIPILFILLVFYNRESIDEQFGKIAVPLAASTFSIYFWYWILNPTKWIRYSQHFSIILLITIIYLINFELLNNKISLFIATFLIAIFIENTKFLIVLLILLSFYAIFKQQKYNNYNLIKILLISVLILDISFPYFEKNAFANVNHIIEDCKLSILSEDCLNAYESK